MHTLESSFERPRSEDTPSREARLGTRRIGVLILLPHLRYGCDLSVVYTCQRGRCEQSGKQCFRTDSSIGCVPLCSPASLGSPTKTPTRIVTWLSTRRKRMRCERSPSLARRRSTTDIASIYLTIAAQLGQQPVISGMWKVDANLRQSAPCKGRPISVAMRLDRYPRSTHSTSSSVKRYFREYPVTEVRGRDERPPPGKWLATGSSSNGSGLGPLK